MNNLKNISIDSFRSILLQLGMVLLLISCADKKSTDEVSDEFPLPDVITEIQPAHLEPMLKLIGNSKIIGVSEGRHSMNEGLDFRNELIKFLVNERRIDVVAIESGLIESRELFDYINGKKGDIDSVLYYGISWTFDRLPQNREIIEWLRNYNSNPSNDHKVRMYGFDVPGSPFNIFANRQLNTAITETLSYLKTVDQLKWSEFESRLNPYIEYIYLNYFDSNDSTKQYIHLSEADRNALTGIINDLIKHFEINEIDYLKKSSEENYQWAYRAAICSRQVDNWLRNIPLNFEIPKSLNEVIASNLLWNQLQGRDRSMLDNLDWIIKREPNTNILLFAHLIHMSKSTTTIVSVDSSNKLKIDAFGKYLASRFGDDYKVIGNFYLKTKSGEDSSIVEHDALANELVSEVSKNYYRQLNQSDKVLLNKEWKYGEGVSNIRFYMNPYQGIDILFFTNTQTQVEIE